MGGGDDMNAVYLGQFGGYCGDGLVDQICQGVDGDKGTNTKQVGNRCSGDGMF